MMFRLIAFVLVLGGVALLAVPGEWPALDAMEVTSVNLGQDPPVIELRAAGSTGARSRLAIPEFSAAGATQEIQAAAKTISEVLWDDLSFEREFYVLPRAEAAKVPAADSIGTLPYDRWSELGVDVVVLGAVS